MEEKDVFKYKKVDTLPTKTSFKLRSKGEAT